MAIVEQATSDRPLTRPREVSDDTIPAAPDFLELREVIHDIRQPLAAMRSIGAELRLRFDEPMLHDRLQLLDSQISLLDDLLGSITPRPSPTRFIDLSSVTGRALAVFRQLHPTTSVSASLRPALAEGLDELTWWRVVQNLLDNASRAAGPSGHIELSLGASGDDVELRVDDDGKAGFGMFPSGESLGLRFVIRTIHARKGRISLEGLPGGGTSVLTSVPARSVAVDHEPRSK